MKMTGSFSASHHLDCFEYSDYTYFISGMSFFIQEIGVFLGQLFYPKIVLSI